MQVCYGEPGWSELYALWQKEGSPYQFERIESTTTGVQRWTVMQQPDDEHVRFLLKAAADGVDPGNDKAPEWRPHSGYSIDVRESGLALQSGARGYRIVTETQPRDESTITFEEE